MSDEISYTPNGRSAVDKKRNMLHKKWKTYHGQRKDEIGRIRNIIDGHN